MTTLTRTIIALSLLTSPLCAQTEIETVSELPEWAIEFSNLSSEQRAQYLEYFDLARAAYKKANWVECMGHLDQCGIIFDSNPNVLNLKAGCLLEMGFYAEAEPIVLKVLKLTPSDAVAILNLSSVYLGKREFEKGIIELQKSLKALPLDAPQILRDILNFRIFLCQLMLGKEEEALRLVAHASPLDDSPLFYFVQCALYYFHGNYPSASKELKTAQSIFGKGNYIRAFESGIKLSGLLELRNKDKAETAEKTEPSPPAKKAESKPKD